MKTFANFCRVAGLRGSVHTQGKMRKTALVAVYKSLQRQVRSGAHERRLDVAYKEIGAISAPIFMCPTVPSS
jgi:hypothetical protein